MPRQDFSSPRLFVTADLTEASEVALEKAQAHYLNHVLRLGDGDRVLAFNGRDGEWRTRLAIRSKATAALLPIEPSRPQPPVPDLVYCFALLKHTRLDYLVQKATEMGVSVLQPVITHRTQMARVNLDRMRANVVEAAEQCGVLHLPDIRDDRRLDALLASWPEDRWMIFCDEDAEVANPIEALRPCVRETGQSRPLGLLIGPEGGFDPAERKTLCALPYVIRLSLGPRVLRADTAAVAALTLIQAVLGDWH